MRLFTRRDILLEYSVRLDTEILATLQKIAGMPPRVIMPPALPPPPVVPPEAVVPEIVIPPTFYELYDLVEQKKLSVTADAKNYQITNKAFRVLLATAEGTDVQVDFSPIVDDSYKVLAGSTYGMTRRARAVEKLYFKGVGIGTLWITIWL